MAHPLPEVLLLVVCGTIADCDDYDGIADWGEAHLAFLRRFLPYHHGVPGGRWLTMLMNRIDPGLFSAASVLGAGDLARPGRISSPSTARPPAAATIAAPAGATASGLAFATTSRLVLGQEAVADKANETTASRCCWSGWP